MRSLIPMCAVTVIVYCSAAAARSQTEENAALDVDALVARFDELAQRDLWPGFDPRATPLAIYDGTHTYLFRHPTPPPEFSKRTDGKDGLVMAGRHPAVVANSSAEIGGITTGTVQLESLRRKPLTDAAAVVIHETFHVYQRTALPGWSGNIAVLFEYPVENGELLVLRRMETEALRRALAPENDDWLRWTAAALEARAKRFARLEDKFTEYERGEELNEGLAQYVEMRASGRGHAELPAEGFPAAAMRLRCYATGNAYGVLLDRVDSEWRSKLSAEPKQSLDEMLTAAMGMRARDAAAFSADETAAIRAAAERDIAALRQQRAERRAAFLAAEGWRIEIDASAAPLWPQGFDPMNVEIVRPGEVLHARFVKLGNDAGTVELHGQAGLTTAMGAHPLFNGVKQLLITGLASEPTVEIDGDSVNLATDTLQIHLKGASVSRSDRTVVIRLDGAGD